MLSDPRGHSRARLILLPYWPADKEHAGIRGHARI
jgi:hypothetical protein